MDPDQAWLFVRPDLGTNGLHRLSADYTSRPKEFRKAFTKYLNNKKSYGIYIPTVLGIFMGLWLLKGTKGSMCKSYSILQILLSKQNKTVPFSSNTDHQLSQFTWQKKNTTFLTNSYLSDSRKAMRKLDFVPVNLAHLSYKLATYQNC